MNGSPVRIRTATIDDLDAIAGLHTRARSDYYRGHADGAVLADPGRAAARRAAMARWLRSPEHTVFLAEKDGRAVGFALIGPCAHPDPDPDVAGEMHLYVDPGHFRQRIGTSLHAACVRGWQRASVSTARLWVQHFNRRAQAFYRSQGWEPDGTHRPDSTDLLGYRLRVPPEGGA